MRSGQRTSSAVTTRPPSPRTETIVLILSSMNPPKAKKAAQSHHPCLRPPKTHQPFRYTHNPTTTALHQQTHPPPLPTGSTVALIHPQLQQHRTPLLLTLQHQPQHTRDSARLLHTQKDSPNLAPSVCRPPIPQRLLPCLPLWHRKFPSLRARLKPKPLE